MKREDLVAFARRDWGALAELDRGIANGRRVERNPMATFAVVDELRAQVHAMRPDHLSEAERQEDLDAHILLAKRLARASSR